MGHNGHFESLLELDSISGLASASHGNKNTIDWMAETNLVLIG